MRQVPLHRLELFVVFEIEVEVETSEVNVMRQRSQPP